MIKKLRNQPYAQKWEQAEDKIMTLQQFLRKNSLDEL
jgi:lipopolysaccharide/colanic/teichoic acid biosynthesis glycosyltransferase